MVQKVEDTGSSQSRSRVVSRETIMMVDSMAVETKESGLYPSLEDEQVNIVRRHGRRIVNSTRAGGQMGWNATLVGNGSWAKVLLDPRCAICGERGDTQVRCHKVKPANGVGQSLSSGFRRGGCVHGSESQGSRRSSITGQGNETLRH